MYAKKIKIPWLSTKHKKFINRNHAQLFTWSLLGGVTLVPPSSFYVELKSINRFSSNLCNAV